jgi:cell wall-associated NlpC family hydrolase
MDVSDLVGVPYKVHGRDASGLDCFGLIWLLAKRNGTPIKDPEYKGFDPSLVKLADYVGLEKNESGCVLEIEKGNRLHLGYAIDKERMIHCTHNEGVIVENIRSYNVKGKYKFGDHDGNC